MRTKQDHRQSGKVDMTTDASTRVRCPRCRSRSLQLNEVGEWTTTWEVRNGRLRRREGYHEPGSYLYVWAECIGCGHHWRVRGAIQITDVVTEDSERDEDGGTR